MMSIWKQILGAMLLSALISGIVAATIMYPPVKYGQQVTIYFPLYDSNSPWRNYETAPAAADVHVFQDGASEARATNAVTDLGRWFSLVVTATEMQAAIVVVDINDATNPPLFGDETIIIPTFGHASALALMDLDAEVAGIADFNDALDTKLPGGADANTVTVANGALASNLTRINDTSIAGTGSQIADAFIHMFNVATAYFTAASRDQTGDAYTKKSGGPFD